MAAAPFIDFCQISVANVLLDGTGAGIVLLTSGHSAGKRVDTIRVKTLSPPALKGLVRIFYSPDNGTNKRLLKEIAIPPSPTATADPGSQVTFEAEADLPPNFVLDATTKQIYVSTHNTIIINVFASGMILG